MILALYGAGAMGREFRQIAEESGKWSGIVFIDDTRKAVSCRVALYTGFRCSASASHRRKSALLWRSANRNSAGNPLTG